MTKQDKFWIVDSSGRRTGHSSRTLANAQKMAARLTKLGRGRNAAGELVDRGVYGVEGA